MKRLVCIILIFCMCCFPLKVGAVGTSAKAAILINGDTGEVIYEQNAHSRLPMASTTKIMTALLLCESDNLERGITVTDQMVRVEGSSMGLLAGDKVTYRDLLYGMLLASGNDAANVTAYALGGTVDGFVKMMNRKAEELELENTHFETPSGLDGDEHYTSAYDLAKLAMTAMSNQEFYKAASSKSATLCYGNPPYRRTLSNHNRLLKTYEGAVGVKTGFTKKSGRCLVSAAKKDGKQVIAVTLNDPNDWADHTSLLNYGLEKIKTAEISPEKTDYSIPVVSADEKIKIKIKPLTVRVVETEGFNCRVMLPKFVYAPVKKGEKLGCAVYYKNGKEIKRENIFAPCSIELVSQNKGFAEKIKDNFKYIFEKIWEI